MAVDVVVVDYKTPELLNDFISSYEKNYFDGCTLTVVKVDTGSSVITDFVGTGTKFMWASDNIGYGRACNWGAMGGKNDVVLLANADTLLSAGLKECHDALLGHDDWGVLGPRQVNENNQITAGGIPGGPHGHMQRGWMQPDQGQCSDILEDVYSVSGSLYFIKRALWEDLTNCQIQQQLYPGIEGAFIPTPHYFEETTCSRHAVAHGYKCVFYGPVKMTHLWHRASDHGGWADRQFAPSLQMHREFCDAHGIAHE